ncbi:hypothetical protein HanIR_Chr07g0321081 [Helianthus annuus]|nr:hypothetical protein HanIR_Chr07g0321081 [Helianthus annuus]
MHSNRLSKTFGSRQNNCEKMKNTSKDNIIFIKTQSLHMKIIPIICYIYCS